MKMCCVIYTCTENGQCVLSFTPVQKMAMCCVIYTFTENGEYVVSFIPIQKMANE